VAGFYRTFVRAEDGSTTFMPAREPAQLALGETILRAMRSTGEVIAEDLGMVPELLRPSLERLGVPGYKVLRWERDGETFRDPGGWPKLSVATNATHDTTTTATWYEGLSEGERAELAKLPGLHLERSEGGEERGLDLAAHPRFDDAVRDALLRVLYAAPSELAIVPFEDALGGRAQINHPGEQDDSNWSYRMPRTVEELEADGGGEGGEGGGPDARRLRALAQETGRLDSAT
jgi:4-alpha-glucanotransferase